MLVKKGIHIAPSHDAASRLTDAARPHPTAARVGLVIRANIVDGMLQRDWGAAGAVYQSMAGAGDDVGSCAPCTGGWNAKPPGVPVRLIHRPFPMARVNRQQKPHVCGDHVH